MIDIVKAKNISSLGSKVSKFFASGFVGVNDVPWVKTDTKNSSSPVFNCHGSVFIKDVTMGVIVIEIKGTTEIEQVENPKDGNPQPETESIKVIGEVRFAVADLITNDYSKGEWFNIQTLVKDSKTKEDVSISVGQIFLCFKHFAVDVGQMDDIYEVGKLHIDILKGRNLPAADMNGTSDTYCICNINEEQIYKTKVMHKNLNPEWQEEFTVDLSERNTSTLELSIMDWDKIGKHELLGTASIPLHRIPIEQVQEYILPLEGAKKGEIHVRILFVPQRILGMSRDMTKAEANKNVIQKLSKVKGLVKVPIPIPNLGKETFKKPSLVVSRSSSIYEIESSNGSQEKLKSSNSNLQLSPDGIAQNKKIDFELTDFADGNLSISLGKGRNMKLEKENSDCYVKVISVGSKKTLYRTKNRKSKSPEWGETFSIKYQDLLSESNTDQYSLCFSLKEFSGFSTTELGQVTVNLLEEMKNKMMVETLNSGATRLSLTNWYPIKTGENESNILGEVQITVTFDVGVDNSPGKNSLKSTRSRSGSEITSKLLSAFRRSSSGTSLEQ
jgi:Ca2+-dependent lipid-binding protein